MDDANGDVSTIVFVCLHGSAKSLIAAEHVNRLARLRGASIRGESLGLEPDADVPPNVVIGLAADGIDVHGYVPRPATPQLLANAACVVSFGCDLNALVPAGAAVEQWDDMPMVSDGYAPARAAIVERVEGLLDSTCHSAPPAGGSRLS
jgi:arsenate reductase (thioredoxin)